MDTLQFVPLYRLIERQNYRQTYDPDLVHTIAVSVRDHGFKIEYPITVYAEQDRLVIIDGHTRYHACVECARMSHNMTFGVWAVVKARPDDKTFKLAQLAANELRSDPDDISKAIGYKQAIDAGASIDDLVLAVGHKRPYIEDRLSLLALVPEAKDLVAKKHLGIKFAAQLTRLDSNFQRIALQAYTAMKSPTLEEFTAIVNGLYTKQTQCSLFDLALFNGQPIEQTIAELKIDRPKSRQELLDEIEALRASKESEYRQRMLDRDYAKRKYTAAQREIALLKAQLSAYQQKAG